MTKDKRPKGPLSEHARQRLITIRLVAVAVTLALILAVSFLVKYRGR